MSDHGDEFRKAVRSAFEFLERDYGYELAEESDWVVEYRSPKAIVRIDQERPGYSFSVAIGPRSEEPFALGLVIQEIEGLRGRPAEAHVFSSEHMPALARRTRERADRALRGDAALFRTLRERQKRYDDEYLQWMEGKGPKP